MNGNWTQGTNSILFLTGFPATSGSGTLTATASPNTVNYTGAGVTVKPVTYNKLTLSGSGTYILTSLTTINSDFNVQGSVTATSVVNTVGGNLNVSGTSALTLGDNLAVTGNVNITGSVSVTDGNFTVGVATMTIASGGTYTHSGNAAVSFTGDLTMNGTLNGSGTGTMTVNNNVTGTGSINLTGNTFEQRVSANKNFFTTSGSNVWAFNNLTFSNSSVAATALKVTTLTGGSGGGITVSSVLTLGKAGDTAGATTTLDPGNQTWTFTGTGTVFTVTAARGIFCAPGSCVTNTSTFDYKGNGNTTITASLSYYNLTRDPIITGSITDTTAGAITVNNNFTINPTAASTNGLTMTLGGPLIVSNGTLNVDGTTNGFGVLDTASGSNFAITANALSILAGASGAVNNLNANNSTLTLTGTGTPLSIAGSFATFTRGNSTVNYTGNGATILVMGNGTGATNSYYNLGLTPGGASQQILGAGTLDVNGNLDDRGRNTSHGSHRFRQPQHQHLREFDDRIECRLHQRHWHHFL